MIAQQPAANCSSSAETSSLRNARYSVKIRMCSGSRPALGGQVVEFVDLPDQAIDLRVPGQPGQLVEQEREPTNLVREERRRRDEGRASLLLLSRKAVIALSLGGGRRLGWRSGCGQTGVPLPQGVPDRG